MLFNVESSRLIALQKLDSYFFQMVLDIYG